MVIAPARRAGDPGSIPGPGENFSLKLLIYDLSEGYSKAKSASKPVYLCIGPVITQIKDVTLN